MASTVQNTLFLGMLQSSSSCEFYFLAFKELEDEVTKERCPTHFVIPDGHWEQTHKGPGSADLILGSLRP